MWYKVERKDTIECRYKCKRARVDWLQSWPDDPSGQPAERAGESAVANKESTLETTYGFIGIDMQASILLLLLAMIELRCVLRPLQSSAQTAISMNPSEVDDSQ